MKNQQELKRLKELVDRYEKIAAEAAKITHFFEGARAGHPVSIPIPKVVVEPYLRQRLAELNAELEKMKE